MRIVGFLFLSLLGAAFASAQGGTAPVFAHDALSCVSTEEFPIVEAVLDPAELRAVQKAQVYFKASHSDAWYFVEMEPGEEPRLQAVLPKPLAETEGVDYYLFFLTASFEPAQSQEFSARVSESGCGVRREAVSTPASLTLRATLANQAPIPPGFQPSGITSLVTTTGNTVAVGAAAGGASGGISGATVGIIAGGGAAAATGVAVAGGGGDDTTTTPSASPDPGQGTAADPPPSSPAPSPDPAPSPEPTPSPPPAPTVPDISGTWILDDQITASCEPSLLGRTSRSGMVIQQNGTSLTASRNGQNASENLTGTIDMAGNIAMSGTFVDEGETGQSSWEATTTSGSEMRGTYTWFFPEFNCTIRRRFSGTKN